METRNLNTWFGQNNVLKKINVVFKKYSITAIMGPSGCGKTTLIRSLNRMNDIFPIHRSMGEIILDNENILNEKTDVVSLRKRVGMVFQKPNPFPKSIYDNVAFGPKIYGAKKSELNGIVEKSLKDAALWDEVSDRLNDSALSLSGGQQQRLCIARALAVEPEVILMDEPCSAIDPIGTAKIESLMTELKNNITVVIVTHNMQQAARVSDFTAFLYQGDLIEYGVTKNLFSKPQNELTERYITGKFG